MKYQTINAGDHFGRLETNVVVGTLGRYYHKT